MNRTIKLCIATLAIATLAGSCTGKKETSNNNSEERIEPVKVLKLQTTTIERNIRLSTTLKAYESIAISPAMQGRIAEILVDVGTYVTKGQLLAKMDETAYLQAKLGFENLKVDFERVSELNDLNNIAKQKYDQTKAQYNIQKTSLENLERNTYLRAPFDGVISAKSYENGELFTGMPILQLVQISTLKALVNIPETYYPEMKKGMPISIESDIYPDKQFGASIEIIYPTIDAMSHTFQVQIRIPNSNSLLRPGMYVHSVLAFGKANALIAPYQSVLKLQGTNERYVFINNDGVAQRVVVTIGKRFDDKVEIISHELKNGDELVITGQARLNNGSKIQVTE